MKRILLGLLMVGSVALAAAPMANAQNAGTFCGHNYAFLATGTEPVTATSAGETLPLNYAAGIGVLQFAAAGTAGPGQCTFGGEMIYVDNDYQTFQGGPTNCPTISSAFGELPCFDGVDTHIVGASAAGPNGSNTLEMGVTFPSVVGVSNTADVTLPFTFTVFTTKLAATLVGNSNIPAGGTAPGDTSGNTACDAGLDPFGCGPNAPTPPLGPILNFTAQEQSVAATEMPVPTVYGQAPYVGASAIVCSGFGGNSTDLVASGEATQSDEATGGYGVTSGSLNAFPNGEADGSLSFNSNDDVGNTTGLSNYDCDFQQANEDAFNDGTNDNQALITNNQFYNPYTAMATLTCRDADAGLTASPATPIGAAEVNSSVVWGSTNQNGYSIVTGVATPAFGGGAYLPPGSTTTCTALQESPASGKVTIIKPTTPLLSHASSLVTSDLNITNASEAGCLVTATMPPVTGAVGLHGGQCTVELAGNAPFDISPSPINFGVESFSGTNTYATIHCTCSDSTAGVAKAQSTLTITSTNCQLSGPVLVGVTCEN